MGFLGPYTAFNFYVSLIDSSSTGAALKSAAGFVAGFAMGGGFSECTGLDGTLQIEEYVEGGENSYTHKFATRMTFSNIILKRGVAFSEELYNWHHDYLRGKGKRRDGVIYLLTEQRAPVKMWVFREGLPLKWSGPAFNAATSALAVESMEIAHHGLELLSAGTAAAAVSDAVFG